MPRRPEMILRSLPLLRELMVLAHHNTVTLAAEVGVRKQLIGYLASGSRSSCSTATAERIAGVLGCEVGTLFSNQMEEESANREEEGEVLLTIPEAGKAIGVSKSHAYRLVADGELPVVDVGRSSSKKPKSRVSMKAIEAFIARREAQQS